MTYICSYLHDMKVTLDTNILPADDLIASVLPGLFEFAIVSVTNRETEGTKYNVIPENISNIPETMVWDESRFDEAVWDDSESASCLEFCLKIISGGNFPPPDKRDKLTRGRLRQLRDAMIFCDHVRDGGEIFVTNDTKGFVKGGRRASLEKEFHTRIMTRIEFLFVFGEKA